MPAACTLLLLLGLGLVPVPPAGSLPLASPRRLPPPPPPPPPSRNRLGRPSSPPAAGHAGSPVIESSHQERSSSTEIRTPGAPLDSMELVMMLAGSREWAWLPARHRVVPAASRVTGHTGPPASDGDVTPPGAGSPENPSAGTVTHLLAHSHPSDPGSHHHAAGRQERGKRALASPNTPGAAGGTPPGLEAVSTDSAEGMQGGVWEVSGFNNTMRTVLLPSSSESHHSGEPSQFSLGTLGKYSNTWEQGTDSLSQPVSSWGGTELGSSPAMGTAAASPSPLGSSPSTALPGSLGQPQASSQASSTQTGAEHIMLHPRGAMGNSTSPLLTASPPTDSTFGAVGSSYQPSDSSATERRGLDFHTSTSVSTTGTKGGGRTLRSLPASTRLVTMAEISTSGTEITSSSAQSQTPGMSVGAQGGGGRSVTDPLLTGSPSASESASTTFSSNYEPPKSIPGAEEVTLHSDPQGADMSSMAVGTPMSPENGHTAGVTRDSATSTDPPSSSGRTSSSLRNGTHHPKGSREGTDLPGPPGSPFLTSSLSASEGPFRGARSSHRPEAEKTSLPSSATNAPISAVSSSSSSSGRPPRSASGSSLWAAAEGSTSSSGTHRTLGTTQSLSTSSVRETYRAQGSTGMTDFTEVADSSLTHSHSPSEGPSPATGSSHVSFSILSTEQRTNFPTTSTSVSTTGTKGGGKTLRSLPASTTLAQTTEIATTGTENISSPGHSQSSLGTQDAGGRGATVSSVNPLHMGSASESNSPENTSAMGGRLPLTSTPSVVSTTASKESSTVLVLDPHRPSSATGSSAPTPPHTSTLDTVLLSSSAAEPGKQSNVSQSGAGLSELPTKLLPAFSPSISVPSPSATLFVHKEGTSQAPGSHSMWSTEAESLTSHPDTAGDTHTGPIPSSTVWPGMRHVSSGRAGSPEPKGTLSSRVFTYSSAAGELSTIGSSHRSVSSSGAEERMSSPITEPVYSSSTPAGGEESMLHSVTHGTLAGGTESSSSHAEASSSPEPSEPALVAQGRTANVSSSGRGFAGFATETVFVHSAKIPTYSSFQNNLTNSSGSHQPVSSIDAEKRTSVSHTDGTYISTTYTRGGERTLLSISNSSTSADSSESSTFFSEISSPFDASKSSVAHDRQTNASNSSSFVGPSTEPLLVHPSKLLTSASTDSIENTTHFNTDTELLATDRSSLSSSAFPASSSVSSLQHSLSSTPPPTRLFTLSEPPELRLPSVMASSPPLQALSSSLPTSTLPSPSYSLTSLLPVFSSPSSISQSSDSDQASTTVVTNVVRQLPSTAATAGSSPRETNKPNVTHQPQNSTTFTPTRSPLSTAPMELLGGRIVSVSAPVTVTETVLPGDATTQGDSFGKATPQLTTASVAPWVGPTDAPLSPSPSATNHSNIVPTVAVTTVKPPVLTMPASRRPTPGEASTVKDHRAQTPTATKHRYTTGKSTEAMDPTPAKPGKVTEENMPVTSPSEAPPTTKTTVSIATTLAATKPTNVPPSSSTVGLRTSPPATEVDKCLSNPCPALATCNNTHGSYICQCPLGYELEKGKCNLVRIFIGQVPLKLNITHGKYAELFHVEREILEMLNASLSGLPGYHHSTVKASREANFVHVSVQSTFSLASNVTFYDVISSVKSYIRACKSPTEACQFISSLKSLHRVGSLCRQKDPECDKETSECTDFDGVALCQCKNGYFKYNKMDHSCRACEDGYKLENETCVSCPFGLGGFNCGNPYQLITVVIAAAGGGLLLIMGIALIVTCCRKNKNDISKLIFKSGDFQMSPYAEYPKNPRAQEWGRETIEMQENGSTKNLLQMTDVYYSPTGLRNPELERNGLYPPYTGLPGSRHSCIYPGQYNPSFISDETRRRDYF
ncbi:protein HEG homolog 1 isoform X2 [Corvus cornix cornix]|uniref:protein HEG homolog 1 isoform X2 n=1 Tax=Corvus cornix cornix TaxID=932674 RepID=UPI00195048B4|nr:protein HEG homolog 1 isoform X2 [Corvus cornix cornix]